KWLLALMALVWFLNWGARSAEPLRGNRPGGAVGQGNVDRFGVPLPERAIARIGSVFLRHDGWIRRLVFSADGKVLACGCGSGTVCVWDLAVGRKLRQIDRQGAETCVALSPGGQLLATGGAEGKGSNIWHIRNGQAARLLPTDSPARSLRFAPEGKLFAAGAENGDIYLWALVGDHLHARLRGHREPVGALAFSPDSRQLASGSRDKTVCLWQLPA